MPWLASIAASKPVQQGAKILAFLLGLWFVVSHLERRAAAAAREKVMRDVEKQQAASEAKARARIEEIVHDRQEQHERAEARARDVGGYRTSDSVPDEIARDLFED